ncbi:hypothetical protein RFI_29271 [Reticulomyxa filosa]|uniref:Uncharacterized protein n=1 Tax=Reticulomyxa filosa TaxID=46433 RepID=X6M3S1_RETFI|nr:hypothetical protein RFI_29271 [Reticulomyxa filosa]|eukprot:ETO08117.1 hypothetical protein RFI_29271 [Reticulomyxa filosa]
MIHYKDKDNCIESKNIKSPINDYSKIDIDFMKKYSHKIAVRDMQKILLISGLLSYNLEKFDVIFIRYLVQEDWRNS